MTQTKHPPGDLAMTPEMLLNVAAEKIFHSGLDVTRTHVIGYLNGELVVAPWNKHPGEMIICAALAPGKLKYGLNSDHWNQLSNSLYREYRKLKL